MRFSFICAFEQFRLIYSMPLYKRLVSWVWDSWTVFSVKLTIEASQIIEISLVVFGIGKFDGQFVSKVWVNGNVGLDGLRRGFAVII